MAIDQQKNILIITPTLFKNLEVLERCIKSIENQKVNEYIKIYQLIVYDGYEKDMSPEFFKYKNMYTEIIYTNEEKSNTWGAYARQFGIDAINNKLGYFNDTEFDYLLFLDDDNYLFSEFVDEMYNSILKNNTDAAICKIYHHGPVNSYYNSVLKDVNNYEEIVAVISGNPPELFNIDTLNVMFKYNIWLNNKWEIKKGNDGYLNDGITYEKILKNLKISYVNKILAIHY